MRPSRDIATLIEIMAALRTPGSGCPWDLEQDFASIAPYTIEEVYEVADAIERGDMDDLRDELGDLLLQVVFHARMAQETGDFDFGDVCLSICEKLIRRHPHVFAEAAADNPSAVKETWEAIKASERAAKADAKSVPHSLLDDVPAALPALTRAVKLQRRAGRVGFDWNDPALVLEKIREEADEIGAELGSGSRARMAEEIGDLLFAVANLARHLDIDPEDALRAGNAKFVRRFGHIERRAAGTGRDLASVGLEEMEGWWNEAKALEVASS